jgi:hypothetical protein
VYGYLMIVGVNTGFHEAPVFRVRSARLPGWNTTAASLGRETIVDYTEKARDLQTRHRTLFDGECSVGMLFSATQSPRPRWN